MRLKHKQFIEWGRIGGKIGQRRLLKSKISKRDSRIVQMYTKEGKTLASIGDYFGVSRERIRQILKKLAIDSKSKYRK